MILLDQNLALIGISIYIWIHTFHVSDGDNDEDDYDDHDSHRKFCNF